MSHHGNNPFNDEEMKAFAKNVENFDLEKALKTRKPEFNLSGMFQKPEGRNPYIPPDAGATGNFPDGKISEKDEGEIKIGFTIDAGKLIMSFGNKPISWIGFTKKEAEEIGNYLIEKSKEI